MHLTCCYSGSLLRGLRWHYIVQAVSMHIAIIATIMAGRKTVLESSKSLCFQNLKRLLGQLDLKLPFGRSAFWSLCYCGHDCLIGFRPKTLLDVLLRRLATIDGISNVFMWAKSQNCPTYYLRSQNLEKTTC